MSLSCILPVDLQGCQLPNLQRTLSWTWRISAWEIFLLMLIGVRLDNQLRAMQIESLDTTLPLLLLRAADMFIILNEMFAAGASQSNENDLLGTVRQISSKSPCSVLK